eukprot:6230503-Prymnesium_polylepis.1
MQSPAASGGAGGGAGGTHRGAGGACGGPGGAGGALGGDGGGVKQIFQPTRPSNLLSPSWTSSDANDSLPSVGMPPTGPLVPQNLVPPITT